MKEETHTIPPPPAPPAPVTGGMRWRDPLQDLYDYVRVLERRSGKTPRIEPSPSEPEEPAEPVGPCGPHISTTPPEEAQVGAEYVYQPKALDGIANGFTWFLEEAPPGMSVDRHTGRVAWTPADGGHTEVVLGVRSQYGKFTRQRWHICVRKPPAVRRSVPNHRFRAALRRRGRAPLPAPRFSWRAASKQRPPPRFTPSTAPPETRRGAALPLRL